MSHFVLIVALPPGTADTDAALTEALAPFDENTDVEPWHDYGMDNGAGPESHWSVKALREKGALPDSPLTWTQVATAHNTAYPNERPILIGGDGRPYEVTTYNPRAKWDWWTVGGRWHGYWPVTPGCESDPLLVNGESGAFGNAKNPGCIDGGPLRCLDIARRQDEHATDAGAAWDSWHAATADMPDAEQWSVFRARITDGYTVDDARRDYGAQEKIRYARSIREWDCPLDKFSGTREGHVAAARLAASAGYAHLDLDGVWHEPGRMGWFGMSDSTDDSQSSYKRAFGEWVATLDPDTILIAVDCHI